MSSLTPRIDRIDKNYLINGGFDFFQRNTGSVTIGGGYSYQTADRWAIGYNAPLVSQSSGRSTIVPDNSVKYSLRLSANAPGASPGNLLIRQRIEAANSIELAGQSVSVSLWVRCESASEVRIYLQTPTAEDNYTSVTGIVISGHTKTVTVGTSWQLLTWEGISIPTSANLGLEIIVEFKNFTVTGLIKDHFVTKVMLNVGNKASDFARAGRNIGQELALCQRYYEKSTDLDVIPSFSFGGSFGTGLMYQSASGAIPTPCTVYFKVAKRALPTVNIYNTNSGAIANMNNWDGGTSNPATINNQNTTYFIASPNVAVTAGHRLFFNFAADAEL